MACLSPLEDQALATFREGARRILHDRVVRIVLFGSRARGEGHEHSDLDVVVVASTYIPDERRAIIDVAARILVDTGLVVSPIVRTEEELARSWPLRGAVERDGVSL